MRRRFCAGALKAILPGVLSLIIVLTGSQTSFATGETQIFDSKFYGDYTNAAELSSDTIGKEVYIDFMLDGINWLGIDNKRTGRFRLKTGMPPYDLSAEIPNLQKFALAQEIAQTKLVGYTFACTNHGGTWDASTGRWTIKYNDPEARLRSALEELGSYISTSQIPEDKLKTGGKVYGVELEPWTDNKLTLKKGASVQFGDSTLLFKSNVTVNDIYDPVKHPDDYESQFAYFVFNLKRAMTLEKAAVSGTEGSTAAEGDSQSSDQAGKILIKIPAGTILTMCETTFTVTKDIQIEITGSNIPNGASLEQLYSAIGTAAGADNKYTGFSCDSDAFFKGVFAVINDFVGTAAESDTVISVCSENADGQADPTEGQAGETGDQIQNPDDQTEPTEPDTEPEPVTEPSTEPTTEACAAFTIYNECPHNDTTIQDKIAPTFTKTGYTGDTYCNTCGRIIKEGTAIAKRPSSIKLSASSVTLKVGQSSSALKVTFKSGDSIKSVKSSSTSIVTASKSGSTNIKLKAGKKVGTAKVTVTLASGKTATATVKVQKKAVACTGIKVKSGTSVTLKKGKTHQIKAERSPATCVQKLTYKSSNKKVATVTKKGKIKAKKKGTAKITIKCGTKKKVVKVKVK